MLNLAEIRCIIFAHVYRFPGVIILKRSNASLALGFQWRRALAVALLIIYQVTGQLVLFRAIVNHAEDECIDRLRDATRQFSSTYYEHAMSDREQLEVVADMLAVLMAEGSAHDLPTHLSSFEQRGMLDWLQVLLPDGTLITGFGHYDMSAAVAYEAEASRLPYISNVSPGYLDATHRVIRSAVPINQDGETVAILYGVYDLSTGHNPGGVTAYDGNAYTFVMEADTGSYILDGLRGHQTIGTTGSTYEAKPGFSLEQLDQDLKACREGYSAFHSLTLDEYMYIYYAPIGINSWMTMVSLPESVAMSFALESRGLMMGSVLYISLGIIIFFAVNHAIDRRLQNKSDFISQLQSKLMAVYQRPEYYREALLDVSGRAKSDAVFLADEQMPRASIIAGSNEALVSAYKTQAAELIPQMLDLCRQQRKSLRLHVNSRVLRGYPDIKQFLQQNNQAILALSPIISPDGSVHQFMGAFSPENLDVLILLDTTAVDFFMAASSMDHLNRLEIAGTVDSLTGAMNRTSYHLRLDKLHRTSPQGLACVYVDVNDLHAINNRFGHEAGDAMLRTIASALMDAFDTRNVFRFGGDEFIVLIEHVTNSWLDAMIQKANAAIISAGYTVSIGQVFEDHPTDADSLIRAAEAAMYKAKYQFYQEKEKKAVHSDDAEATHRLLTDNADVNTFLQLAEDHYRGVYIVNLRTGQSREIIAQGFLFNAMQEDSISFMQAFQRYIAEAVDKQSRRNVQHFFVPEQISAQVASGENSIVEFTRTNGRRYRLTVSAAPGYTPEQPETLWVFEIL